MTNSGHNQTIQMINFSITAISEKCRGTGPNGHIATHGGCQTGGIAPTCGSAPILTPKVSVFGPQNAFFFLTILLFNIAMENPHF